MATKFSFVGVSTAGSAIRRVFPAWAAHLGLGEVKLARWDLPVGAPAESYRDVVTAIKQDPDNLGGLVTTHLVGIGRTRIAHITGLRHSPAAQQRALGVTHALDEHGLRLAGRVRYGLWSQRWARQATRDVLAKVPYVDAIACGSDQIAAAAMEVVIASGRKVPDDVAITGYDNWPVFALETDPSLTTLDMELEHLGAAAVSDLFAVIGGARVGGGTRHHEGTLVIRGSTDPRLS